MSEQNASHSDVAEAFDAIAPEFESAFENAVTAKIRRMVYDIIRDAAAPGSSILDINCGIGIDAMVLAAAGYKVTGIDVSAGMIAQAVRRAALSPSANAEFLVSSFEDLGVLQGRTYDAVLSNFGGLNCTDSLDKVFPRVANVLDSGGTFIAVAMPKMCLWEIAAGFARLRPDSAFRRFQGRVRATGFDGHSFDVHYHPLRRFLSTASRWFNPTFIRAISLLSPPPHAQAFRNNSPRLAGMLDNLDTWISALPGLRGMGDHYLVVFRKNDMPAGQNLHE